MEFLLTNFFVFYLPRQCLRQREGYKLDALVFRIIRFCKNL